MKEIIPQKVVESKILFIRDKKVILDRDLAMLYGVETRTLNQAVKRNIKRFPPDFMFQLTAEEMINWKSQIVISNQERMGINYRGTLFVVGVESLKPVKCIFHQGFGIIVQRSAIMKTVQTRKDVSSVLSSHRQEIESLGVKRIGLFGSFVKGKQNKESDVDLLVEFMRGKKNFKNFIHLAYLLEDLLHRKVELITPESLSPYLKPHILKEIEYVL